MEKNMAKELTFLMQLEWNTLASGFKTDSAKENGLIPTEPTFKDTFRIINLKEKVLGFLQMEIKSKANTTK
jgi:hypothetical protein